MSFVKYLKPSQIEVAILKQIIENVRYLMVPGSTRVCVIKAELEGINHRDELQSLVEAIMDMYLHINLVGVYILDFTETSIWLNESQPISPTKFNSEDRHQLTALDIVRCALVGAAGGYTYSFNSQACGILCDDVYPNPEYKDLVGFSGGKELGWHTEDASFLLTDNELEYSTFDILSIAYLRNPNKEPTLVSQLDFSKMNESTYDILRQPLFVKKSSISHQGDKLFTATTMTPLVFRDNLMSFSFARFNEQRVEYEQAGLLPIFEELTRCLDENSQIIPAIPGTIAFIDNMRVAHARSAWLVPPKFDGTDRWLRRSGSARVERREFLESLMLQVDDRAIDAMKLNEHLRQISNRQGSLVKLT